MTFRPESTVKSLFARPIEAWVWPLTAAIVLGGSILFWSLAGLFWLAMHPTERSVVIWMAPGTNAEQRNEANISQATTAAENRDDAQAN